MNESLRDLYQEVILDHSRHPRHFGPLEGANRVGEGYNPLCGDRVKVYLAVDRDNRIADISFEGKGCAISQASASLMTDLLRGRSVAEAESLIRGFLHLVKGEEANSLESADRERLDVMAGVAAFPMRVKCATLAWHALKSALEGGEAAGIE